MVPVIDMEPLLADDEEMQIPTDFSGEKFASSGDLPDSDDEEMTPKDDQKKEEQEKEKEEEKLSLSDALSRSNGYKDAGNSAFKRNEYAEAGKRYQEGIKILNAYQKNKDNESDDEVIATLISLHGNNAMVLIKLENWNMAIISATEVLKVEKTNIKSLFRRAVSYHKVGFLEEAKTDLMFLLEIDTKNTLASKELAQVITDIKKMKRKEKAAFSSMFKKTIYGDKETERILKEKKEEIEREKENDDWTQSKLSRREKGLGEQSFDDWKKEKKENLEKRAKEDKERNEKNEKERDEKLEKERREKAISEKNDTQTSGKNQSDDENDYDEEDNKILSETKKKGYCYFRNDQSSEVKALIGDITPKAFTVLPPTDTNPSSDNTENTDKSEKTEGGSEGGNDGNGENEGLNQGMKVSSWNHAGTWEEKDMTEFAKSRITSLCLAVEVKHQESEGTGSTVRAYVTGSKSIEGEAQIVLARGKKRFIYDFNVVLEVEFVVEAVEVEGMSEEEKKDLPKSKKFKGALNLPEVSPSVPIESNIQFKKAIPSSFEKIIALTSDSLKSLVCEKMLLFEVEFKSL